MTKDHIPPLPQRVVSKRLLIRPSTYTDVPALQKWWNDPDVMTPGGNPDGMQYDDTDMEAWFQRHIAHRDHANHFVICLYPNDTPIGEFYIACDDRPGAIDFAILIGEKELWGNGYAHEAIQAYAEAVFTGDCCGAMRVNVRRDNERALRLFTGLGFEVEHVWANDQFQTMILTRAAYELEKFKREEYAPAQTGK